MIPTSTTITAEGRRLRRILVACGVVLVAGNVLAVLIGSLLSGPRVGGPSGSSYVTTAFGAAAYAELLEVEGRGVERLRGPYTGAALDDSATLILIDAAFSNFGAPELNAAEEFVEGGGRLLIAGPDPGALIEAISDDPPSWQPGGSSTARAQPSLPGVGTVPLGSRGYFEDNGEGEPILVGEGGESIAVEWRRGNGSAVWLADPTPLLNLGLADGDAAGLAISLTDGRDVTFDEFRHGFGGSGLWQSLPDRWALVIILLGAAALTGLVAYGRRLGPPELMERPRQPERAVFVESVAGILGRTGRVSDAVQPVRTRGRKLLAQRGGLGADASDSDLRTVGIAAGLDAEDVDALINPDGDPVAAGRTLAMLNKRR